MTESDDQGGVSLARQDGFLLVQLSAEAKGVRGKVVVDIRRADGSGGSLRSAKESIAFNGAAQYRFITMPMNVGEVAFVRTYPDPNTKIGPTVSTRELK